MSWEVGPRLYPVWCGQQWGLECVPIPHSLPAVTRKPASFQLVQIATFVIHLFLLVAHRLPLHLLPRIDVLLLLLIPLIGPFLLILLILLLPLFLPLRLLHYLWGASSPIGCSVCVQAVANPRASARVAAPRHAPSCAVCASAMKSV